ncbi:MAG: DUF6049 family protein [Acidimicrobiia bacterium]
MTASALLASAGPAAAATSRAPSGPTATVTLTAQPAWSRPGDDVLLRLRVGGTPSAALEVAAEIHSAVSSRIALEQTINGERLGGTITTRSTPLAQLPVVGPDRVLTLPLQDPAAARDPQRIQLRPTGAGSVFPVVVQLRDPDSGTVASRFVTDLILVPKTPPATTADTRLRVAWLWRVAAAPATNPNGTPAPALAAEQQPGGRLAHLATALSAATELPITIVPNPETVSALAAGTDDSDSLLARLRTAAAGTTVVAGPYTTVEGPGLVRGGLTSAITSQLTTGRTVLERTLGAAVDHTLAAPQPFDNGWLTRLRDEAGTARVVVDPRALADAPPADQYTPAHPFRLDTSGGTFDAVEVNPLTSSLLVRRGSDALRAQQVLAALAVIALEQPNRVRGVVIDTPVLWDPKPGRIDALLAGLRDSPLLEGIGAPALFDTIPAATASNRPYVRTLAPASVPNPPVSATGYESAERRIDALASMTRTDDPLVVRLRHELLVTPASGLPGTGARASARRLRLIRDQVGAIVSGVHAPDTRTFRLTSRRATVPVSILNRTNRALSIRVRLESKKLDFPNGSEQTTEVPPGNPGNKTLSFDVAARASGTFPVLITVSSPDGGLDLQRSRYTVRSSAVSGVGLFLTLGAALFLAVWWFVHWRRNRRPSAPVFAS